MVKTKILNRRRKYMSLTSNKTSKVKLKKDSGLIKYSPTQELLDESFIAKAVWECLRNNDPEGVVEVIQAHIGALDKVKLSKDADVPRSTIYGALKGKNPTVKTLAKLIHYSF